MLVPGRNNSTNSYRYGFNGMEKDDEMKGSGNSYDFGARMYDPRIGRWFKRDPLEVKYPFSSTYAYVANSPLMFIDPDGKQIKGASKDDANEFHNTINKIFSDVKFAKVRTLFTRGKRNKKRKFDKIDAIEVEEALKNLSIDEAALVNEYVNAINSKPEHIIEYINPEDKIEDSDTFFLLNAHFKKNLKPKLYKQVLRTRLVYDAEKEKFVKSPYLPGRSLNIAGGALNIPQKGGDSYSIIQSNIADKDIVSGHEVIGHGRANEKGLSEQENNQRAIQVDNLIRKIIGRSDFRDGTKYADLKKVDNPKANPK